MVWKIVIMFSYSFHIFPYDEKNNTLSIRSDFAQARFVFTKSFSHNQALRFGAEHFYNNDNYNSNDTIATLKDNLTAAFAESDIYIAKNIAAKIGVRAENSSYFYKNYFAFSTKKKIKSLALCEAFYLKITVY